MASRGPAPASRRTMADLLRLSSGTKDDSLFKIFFVRCFRRGTLALFVCRGRGAKVGCGNLCCIKRSHGHPVVRSVELVKV